MTDPTSSRRAFLKAGVVLAGTAAIGMEHAQAQAPSITCGSESKFPSTDALGSSDGGYNILFILTDQEQYMGYTWPLSLPGRERLRNAGTFFENHHIAADMCSASRAVISIPLAGPTVVTPYSFALPRQSCRAPPVDAEGRA